MFKSHKPSSLGVTRSLELTKKREMVNIFRNFLLLETFVYGAWWFVVHLAFPVAYNPAWSRLIVVCLSYYLYLASFKYEFVRKHLEGLFYWSVVVLTAHNFYLKFVNYRNIEWIVSTYITVVAVCACFQNSTALMLYSVFVLVLGVMASFYYHFLYPFYLPGLVTVLIASNLILYQRLLILRRLSEANTRFSELFNATFEGICIHKNGIVLDLNQSFANSFGYQREELLGKSVLLFTDEKSKQLVSEIAESKVPQLYEIGGVKKNGTHFPIEISSKPYRWMEDEVRLVTVRDITDRHASEMQKIKVMEAEAEVRLRDEFISIASHELKTPLTPIKLNLDIFLRAVKSEKILEIPIPKMQRLFQITQNQVLRLNRLIDDMLDVSRMNRGVLEFRFEDFNFTELLEEVTSAFHEEILKANVKLKVFSHKNIPVKMDRHRLEQVLVNLLRNALVYAPNGRVLIYTKTENDKLIFAIRDHGMGIPIEDQNRIFNRFERAVSSKNYGGMGLGLYITKQIIEAHHGKIALDSERGRGSTFIVELPLATQSQVHNGLSTHPTISA
jgi:PAS domain S-box-containing protein